MSQRSFTERRGTRVGLRGLGGLGVRGSGEEWSLRVHASLQTNVNQFALIGVDAAACCSFCTRDRLNNQMAAASRQKKKKKEIRFKFKPLCRMRL